MGRPAATAADASLRYPCRRSPRSALLFLDVDGTLLPFAGGGRQLGDDANSLLAGLDPDYGRRLAALPCDLVWATTWMAEANEVLAPRLGLPDLSIVDWPDDHDDNGRLHWKTRGLVEWPQDAGSSG